MTSLTPKDDLSPPPISWIFGALNQNPQTILLIISLIIGGFTGISIVIFQQLIKVIHSLMLNDLMGVIYTSGPWTLACIPTLGGLIVGLMRWCWRDFGPEIATLMAHTPNAPKISPWRPVGKTIAAAVSLGSGASLGSEGPNVEIGANFALILGQILKISQQRQRLLLGAGAAAGIAAGFNAPIAGVFFALEVVLGTTFTSTSVSVVLLAAVVAAWIAQICLGSQPAFALPMYEVRSPLELPLYIGLGLLAAGVSILYTTSIRLAENAFLGQIPCLVWLGRLPRWLCPAIGGGCVGLAALQWPQILGVGYDTIEAMLEDVQFSLTLLLTLLAVKLAMTALSLGSGLVGGIFAPAMFLGASLGSAYGKLLATVPVISSVIAAPPAYAMVGMAAVLASSADAPLTSILLLFEITRDYRIVLPLMTAVGLSVWLVESWSDKTHESLNLHQMGLDFDVNNDNNDIPNIEPLLDWEKSLNSHIAEVIASSETDSEQLLEAPPHESISEVKL